MASGLYSQHVNNKKMLYLRNTIIILVLVTLAVCCLFPLFYMIVNSFGPAVEAASSNRSVFPTSWSLDSYKAFFSFSEYSVKWLTNTFVVSACQVLGNVVFASLAGYAFAKLKFKGKNFLFNLILIGMMIPYQVTQVPLYILIVNKFHLSNSYAALVLPGLVTSYNIFLTKQFFSSIPTSLLESAKLDGCSQPKIFTHIVLPLSKTILAVLSINTFLSSWNNFFWPFLGHLQRGDVYHSGRPEAVQVCQHHPVWPHDGRCHHLRSAHVHPVLLPAEVLPRGRYGRCCQGLIP